MKKKSKGRDWLSKASLKPVAFSQVREDALQDQWVIQQLKENVRVMMIASGGCTAALLATLPQVTTMVVVDPNPSQIVLTRLKLELLQRSPRERLEILGHETMSLGARRKQLSTLFQELQCDKDVFGSFDEVCQVGPDFSGRYEALFQQLRKVLHPFEKKIQEMLQETDLSTQAKILHQELEYPLKKAFLEVMDLPNLVRLFSAEATRNSVEPFALHFFHRTRTILQTLPAFGNPYLAQVLLGRFTGGIAYPWLSCPTPSFFPKIAYETKTMVDALEKKIAEKQTFHYIHLSNILDWLSAEDAKKTLALAFKALELGGYVLIRQLNSNLEIRQLAPSFVWHEKESLRLHQQDRSYFYRAIHLGQKP